MHEPGAHSASSPSYITQAFGLRWESDWPVPWFADAPRDIRPIDIKITRRAVLGPRPDGYQVNRGELFADGTRFAIEDAVIDMYEGSRIDWFGPGLNEVPLALCSTVASHVLAWRGFVPLHGSAVAFDNQAILIAGDSGAGKSTLAHALVEFCGGRLISDDLSVLLPTDLGSVPMLIPGRPTIRLTEKIGEDKEMPKLLVWPPRVDADQPVPLGMLLLLQEESIGTSPSALTAALASQLFRPKWMRVLPEARLRRATLFQTAQRIAIACLPPASSVRHVAPAARAAEAIALLRQHKRL